MKNSVISVAYSEGTNDFISHYHDCHEIFYIASGNAEITIGQGRYRVSDGSMVIISRYEEHSVSVKSNSYKRYTLSLSPSFFGNKEDYRLYSLLTNRPKNFSHVIEAGTDRTEFEMIFKNLLTEFNGNGEYSEDMTAMLLKQLLIKIYRKKPDFFSMHEDNVISVVESIQRVFQQSCGEKYTLDSLSEKYNVSVFYLSHLFKRVTGYSVMSYLLSCRIANAKLLLSESGKRIAEIAQECGFSDSSDFSRRFRQETGMSPSLFRENAKMSKKR